MIPTTWYIALGIFLFCLGVFAVITRRNTVIALIGIELMLNAANLNFVAFGRLQDDAGRGAERDVPIVELLHVGVGDAIRVTDSLMEDHRGVVPRRHRRRLRSPTHQLGMRS